MGGMDPAPVPYLIRINGLAGHLLTPRNAALLFMSLLSARRDEGTARGRELGQHLVHHGLAVA